MDRSRFRELSRRAACETSQARRREIIGEMLVLLREEQRELRHAIAARLLSYRVPPVQPGFSVPWYYDLDKRIA